MPCGHDAVMSADRTTGFTDMTNSTVVALPAALDAALWPAGTLGPAVGIWLLLFPCWWSVALAAAPHWGNMVG